MRYQFSKEGRLPVFAGLVHWNQQGDKTMDEQFHYVSYWPKATNNGAVGTAILFPEKAKLIDFQQHLGTELKLKSGEVFTFYVGAAWDKAGKITDAEAWKRYVKNYAQRIAHPIQIKSN